MTAYYSYRPVKSFNDSIQLQEDINCLHSWAYTWLMNFNISKCYSMNITQSRTNFISTQYYLDNRPLTIVDHCKYLGVVFQSNLNWTKHVEKKVAKANTTLSMLTENKLYPNKRLSIPCSCWTSTRIDSLCLCRHL